MRIIGAVLLLIGAAGYVFAGPSPAPEIDGGTSVAAIAFLSGGLLVLRARPKK